MENHHHDWSVFGVGAAAGVARAACNGFVLRDEAPEVKQRVNQALGAAESRLLEVAGDSARRRILLDLEKTRLALWGGSLTRFHRLFSRLENLDITDEPLVELLDTANISAGELALIHDRSARSLELLLQATGVDDPGLILSQGRWHGLKELPAFLLSGLVLLGGVNLALAGRASSPTALAAAGPDSIAAETGLVSAEAATAPAQPWHIPGAAPAITSVLNDLGLTLNEILDHLEGPAFDAITDYRELPWEQKHLLYLAAQCARLALRLLDAPLVITNEAGNQYPDHEQLLTAGRELLAAVEEEALAI